VVLCPIPRAAPNIDPPSAFGGRGFGLMGGELPAKVWLKKEEICEQ